MTPTRRRASGLMLFLAIAGLIYAVAVVVL